jgi:acetolactate synthase-1/3 small subunit
MTTHTISVLVENHSGALSSIAGLFSSRGYNISSLTVAETDDPTVSRMTIVVSGEEEILEQIVKQLNRLIDVIKVIDFTSDEAIEREMILVVVDTSKSNRHELIELGTIFGAKIATVSLSSVTIEMMGTRRHIDDFLILIKPYGIKEIVRSGTIALAQSRK